MIGERERKIAAMMRRIDFWLFRHEAIVFIGTVIFSAVSGFVTMAAVGSGAGINDGVSLEPLFWYFSAVIFMVTMWLQGLPGKVWRRHQRLVDEQLQETLRARFGRTAHW